MKKHLIINQYIYIIFFVLVMPNALFDIITYWTGDIRPLFNIDYFIPFLLLIPKNIFIKIIGAISYATIFIFDILLIVLQHFPTLHFRDAPYFLGYIFSGPKIFLIYIAIAIAIIAIEILAAWIITKKIGMRALITSFILLCLINVSFYFINISSTSFTIYNTSLAGSNSLFFFQHQQSNFSNLLGGDLLEPTKYQQASMPWMNAINQKYPLNKKLLLIVVESWGQPLNNTIQEEVIKKLKAQKDRFVFFEQGSFPFRGFTVEGELRELCQLHPSTVDLYQINTGFQNCLPNILKKQGYKTQSIHGGNSQMYAMQSWYPKAGFQQRFFKDDLNIPAHCIAFDGICDWDILPFIKQSFAKNEKIFNYWLTLTAHHSYFTHDIHNTRFKCSKYNISKNSDACHNLMLHAQFFDYIAELVESKEMQNVEVIIVGDHPPPLFKAEEIAVYKTKEMPDGKVSWLHFKIK